MSAQHCPCGRPIAIVRVVGSIRPLPQRPISAWLTGNGNGRAALPAFTRAIPGCGATSVPPVELRSPTSPIDIQEKRTFTWRHLNTAPALNQRATSTLPSIWTGSMSAMICRARPQPTSELFLNQPGPTQRQRNGDDRQQSGNQNGR